MSIWHLLLLLVILLVVFGPSKLEGIGVSLGKAVRGFKKGIDGEEDKVSTTQKSESPNNGQNAV
jgi:sec-independent protein translocase protein TatA